MQRPHPPHQPRGGGYTRPPAVLLALRSQALRSLSPQAASVARITGATSIFDFSPGRLLLAAGEQQGSLQKSPAPSRSPITRAAQQKHQDSDNVVA